MSVAGHLEIIGAELLLGLVEHLAVAKVLVELQGRTSNSTFWMYIASRSIP